ncbi:cyclin-domain-containing protein, partial [Jimgerdemannia flammicorona]
NQRPLSSHLAIPPPPHETHPAFPSSATTTHRSPSHTPPPTPPLEDATSSAAVAAAAAAVSELPRSPHYMEQHFDIATHPVHETLKLVAYLLESILAANDRLPNATVTHFHSRAIPNIGVQAYLSRILRFAPFTNEVLLSILVYFDRIAKLSEEKQNTFVINSYNIHRLLIASVVVASKYSSDVFYPNTRYAKVGGLPITELNSLELEFLFLCNFDLHVRLEDLQEYGDQLLSHGIQNFQLTQDATTPPASDTHPAQTLILSPTCSSSISFDSGQVPIPTTADPSNLSPSTESTCSPKTPAFTPPTSAADSAPPPAKRHQPDPVVAVMSSPVVMADFRPLSQVFPPTPSGRETPKSPRSFMVPMQAPRTPSTLRPETVTVSSGDSARLPQYHSATHHLHLRKGRQQQHPYYHEVWVPQGGDGSSSRMGTLRAEKTLAGSRGDGKEAEAGCMMDVAREM